jgi:hypothetical protein
LTLGSTLVGGPASLTFILGLVQLEKIDTNKNSRAKTNIPRLTKNGSSRKSVQKQNVVARRECENQLLLKCFTICTDFRDEPKKLSNIRK